MRVKICGITNLPDALTAIEAGADALGFMLYERSSRHISIEEAAAITRHVPPFVTKVGVFVDPTAEIVSEALSVCGFNAIQLHGDETPEFCQAVAADVIKAFRINGSASLQPIRRYETAAWLLDSYVPGKAGGTGAQFNWELAVQVKEWGRPILLAGGLTPENVAAAVKQVRPYSVDVSTGVESSPGKKDAAKMRDFIAAAKETSGS